MHGRILIISFLRLEEADHSRRVAHVLQKAGHAVLVLKRAKDDRVFMQELDAAMKGFSPTLILYEEATWTDTCEATECQAKALCKPLPTAASFDTDYMHTVSSESSAKRRGLSCIQKCSENRRELLFHALEAAASDNLIATDSSWPNSLAKQFPYGNAAYYLRTTKYFVVFAGDDVPSEAAIALRIAEGNLILAEKETLKHFPSFASTLIPFESDELAVLIAGYEENPESFAEAHTQQHRNYENLIPTEDFVADFLERQDKSYQAEGKTPVLAYEDAATRVTLCGWFGARNFGDDLLMLNAAHRIQKRYPNAQIMVIGARPNVIRRDYGFEAVEPYDRPGLKRVLEGSKALAFFGGLIFDDPMATTSGDIEFLNNPWIEPTGQAGISLYAAALGVPSVGLGIGAGPVHNETTRRAIRLMSMARMRFLPRDEQTCEWLRLSGVDPALVDKKADLILGARSLVEEMTAKAQLSDGFASGSYFVVSLRRWHLNPSDFTDQVARAVDRVCEATGLKAVLLPFDDDDIKIHQEVFDRTSFSERITLLLERPKEAEFLAILSRSAFAFAMRLHCSILHHVLGKPAVGLDYNDKIAAHFQLMGQEELLIPLDAQFDAMASAMLTAHRSSEAISRQVSGTVAGKAALVDEAFEEFFGIIEEGPSSKAGIPFHDAEPGISAYHPRVASKEHLKRARIETERNELRKQVKKQEAQLSSRAYRTAKAASKVLRPLRKLLK
ncbi:MAG: polysaccharide pyruvyl transferase family protein [Eggerthellaceae bacterium]|nr:polysaccharide pyruvyl transferase family protein [Eggerthellaceae bacterium]